MSTEMVSAKTSVVIRALPETAIAQKPLGRHVHHDPRSREYPADRAPIANVSHPVDGLPLAQPDGHYCSTAHALCGAVNASRARAGERELLTTENAVDVYEVARNMDVFHVDGEIIPGSSGLLACKAARELGLISSYGHAFGVAEALEALAVRPVMTGVPWFDSFDEPDPSSGVVHISPGATVRGGHEVLVTELDADNEWVWCWNSWGDSYGRMGRFALTFDTWARLLADRGDVIVPVV